MVRTRILMAVVACLGTVVLAAGPVAANAAPDSYEIGVAPDGWTW